MKLPNFIIVGAPKAGTTALYKFLENNKSVFMSNPKEVNFFSANELRKQNIYYDYFFVENLSDYEKLFKDSKKNQIIGEASVSYLYYEKTPEKIKKIIPDVKIIIMLRNPVKRAFSHYLMDKRLGLVKYSFEQIVKSYGKNESMKIYYQQYIELGLYYKQIKRYMKFFDSKKIKIYFQKDLLRDPNSIMENLYKFLNINNYDLKNLNRRHNNFSMPKNNFIQKLYSSYWLRNLLSKILPKKIKKKIVDIFFEAKSKPKISKEIENILREIYKKDIENLEKLLEINLSHWK